MAESQTIGQETFLEYHNLWLRKAAGRVSSPITTWCLVSDKTAIPLHDKKPGGIMMQQNYKKRGCMLKTTDETIDITQQTPHMSLACGEFKFKIHKPCCNGQWSRTWMMATICSLCMSLNPYCSGQWSHTMKISVKGGGNLVLILIIVDDGLVLLPISR